MIKNIAISLLAMYVLTACAKPPVAEVKKDGASATQAQADEAAARAAAHAAEVQKAELEATRAATQAQADEAAARAAALAAEMQSAQVEAARAAAERAQADAAAARAAVATQAQADEAAANAAQAGAAARDAAQVPAARKMVAEDPINELLSKRAIYYPTDVDAISEQDKRIVQAHAKHLAEHQKRSVRLEGNADERGSSEYNLALGQRRADGVKKLLLLSGIGEDRIESVSYGEEKPASSAHNEAAWSQNRRTDIKYSVR
ncbi:MAG: peptidoglycan-associated lipoprotein Pal [Candidatus Nitrotoga sp.]|nr:peptidoglycan-associated lipoprotein Pal [Candidatus Nitrotoga sp.]MDW7604000.1 peptidoglycan-associated lipoprotein Pal [Candidatus Nitrotoga sp.]MDW7626071.1 peptidoglycan-associated lipoprotein Pal [Candidatus Nitrotoga sp.]